MTSGVSFIIWGDFHQDGAANRNFCSPPPLSSWILISRLNFSHQL
jgi:hypothetical protein